MALWVYSQNGSYRVEPLDYNRPLHLHQLHHWDTFVHYFGPYIDTCRFLKNTNVQVYLDTVWGIYNPSDDFNNPLKWIP